MIFQPARNPEGPLHYSGCPLDRASALRADPEWVTSTLAAPGRQVIPLWRDQCLVAPGQPPVPLTLTGEHAAGVLEAAEQVVFLGRDGDSGVFAADLSPLPEPEATAVAGAAAVADVRALVGTLDKPAASVLGYARGILHWHRNQRFCGTCGAATQARAGGHIRACQGAGCERLLFPRIEPAVIVLVESAGPPARCLLGRHRGAAENAYSTLAGFVEVGENLEDAVRREVAEEAGVQVDTVTYQGSQAWPFPAGMMLGFRARALSDVTDPDGAELEEARWFTRTELRERAAAGHRLGRPDSIDRFLLRSWLDQDDL